MIQSALEVSSIYKRLRFKAGKSPSKAPMTSPLKEKVRVVVVIPRRFMDTAAETGKAVSSRANAPAAALVVFVSDNIFEF